MLAVNHKCTNNQLIKFSTRQISISTKQFAFSWYHVNQALYLQDTMENSLSSGLGKAGPWRCGDASGGTPSGLISGTCYRGAQARAVRPAFLSGDARRTGFTSRLSCPVQLPGTAAAHAQPHPRAQGTRAWAAPEPRGRPLPRKHTRRTRQPELPCVLPSAAATGSRSASGASISSSGRGR